jgi:hypothetical protein
LRESLIYREMLESDALTKACGEAIVKVALAVAFEVRPTINP